MASKRKAPKRTNARRENKQSKASFVRSLPSTTPAKEVVAKAKEAGISLSEAYVYNVRATSKAGRTRASRAHSSTSPNEVTFRRLVLDLGLARAKTLLGQVEKGLDALVAGH